MHKYLLFAGDEYHPHGGWDDFICDRNSIAELLALRKWYKLGTTWRLTVNHKNFTTDSFAGHWLHIVDRDTQQIVLQETSFKMQENERQRKADNCNDPRGTGQQGNSGGLGHNGTVY